MDIVLSNITLCFGDKRVFSDFSAVFGQGSITCVMGSSGIGKTSLLNILMGLLKPDSGTVSGVPARFSTVFQEDRLCECCGARRNLKLAGCVGDIDSALKELGIEETCKAVSMFSGGMKRRVSLARAMLTPGDAVFLDEPFKGLDEQTKLTAIRFIKRYINGRTLIIVTHEEADAAAFESQILRIG